MKYNDLSFGQAEAVFNKLGGIDGVKDFLSGRTMVVKVSKQIFNFETWRNIKIGNYKNVDKLRSVLTENGFIISSVINYMLDSFKFTLASAEENVCLVNVSVEDLGFKENTGYQSICARAMEFGLQLCSSEVGPQLRLQYKNNKTNEHLFIAMTPIPVSDDYYRIFQVAYNYNGLNLSSCECNSNSLWNINSRFIFRLRK